MRARFGLGVLLLALQAGAIVRGRLVNDRYFCWAPYDRQTRYRIDADLNGHRLSDEQVRQRYRRPLQGVDNRSEQHLFDIIRRAERRSEPRGRVVVRYSVNGGPEQQWRFPE